MTINRSATSDENLSLINGMMQHYAACGDAIEGLRWALPHMLDRLSAEAGSLFLADPEEPVLTCVVCRGPVDVTGLKLPLIRGLLGVPIPMGRLNWWPMSAPIPGMPRWLIVKAAFARFPQPPHR